MPQPQTSSTDKGKISKSMLEISIKIFESWMRLEAHRIEILPSRTMLFKFFFILALLHLCTSKIKNTCFKQWLLNKKPKLRYCVSECQKNSLCIQNENQCDLQLPVDCRKCLEECVFKRKKRP
ncbi:unnamed protein product [Cylicocyclus nassatus]|uniref:Uncharacterized protein n=1 Tax=Cylicocyclus nassatus TaxID=53992 RepID=A0AA36GCV0_CYLNA|nr:unnamed protein product [Cylicocyclus nassatus]